MIEGFGDQRPMLYQQQQQQQQVANAPAGNMNPPAETAQHVSPGHDERISAWVSEQMQGGGSPSEPT